MTCKDAQYLEVEVGIKLKELGYGVWQAQEAIAPTEENSRFCLNDSKFKFSGRFSELLNKVWGLEKLSFKRTTCAHKSLSQVWFRRANRAAG